MRKARKFRRKKHRKRSQTMKMFRKSQKFKRIMKKQEKKLRKRSQKSKMLLERKKFKRPRVRRLTKKSLRMINLRLRILLAIVKPRSRKKQRSKLRIANGPKKRAWSQRVPKRSRN